MSYFDGPKGMEKVIAVLTASHLDSNGGYPYDYEIHDGKVFIATLDYNGSTQLDVYNERELREWEQRAGRYRADTNAGWIESVYETQDSRMA